VVAVGAAIQAHNLVSAMEGIASGNNSLLIDVTPQSLGIITVGGYMDTLIDRNTAIPVGHTKMFSTSVDEQSEVKIEVYQGEGRMAFDNEKLGEFILEGIRPAARGEVRIAVSFEIDADGIVAVTAEDPDTGQEASIRLEASSGLTAEEVSDMRFDGDDDLEF
jgi:molecular chaperone DnaK